MKNILRAHFGPALAMFCLFALACTMGGCALTGKVDKPTTVSNAGGAALVAYGAAGYTASFYFKLNTCAVPPVYPCKNQAVNDRLARLDTDAWLAAKAADRVGATQVQKDNAKAKLDALEQANDEPAVKTQVLLVKPKAGATP